MTMPQNDEELIASIISNRQATFAQFAWIVCFEHDTPTAEVVIVCVQYCRAREYILERVFPHVEIKEMLNRPGRQLGVCVTTWENLDSLFSTRPKEFVVDEPIPEEGKVHLIVVSELGSKQLQITPQPPIRNVQ